MESARPYPPSAARLAEARAQGHLPRAGLTGLAGALLGLGASALMFGPALARDLAQLPAAALGAVAAGGQSALRVLLERLTFTLAGTLTVCFLTVLLASLFAQGLAPGRRAYTRVRFPRLRVARSPRYLFATLTLLVSSFTLHAALREPPESLLALCASFVRELALLAVPCLVIDVAFARARHQASLCMTRGEALEDQRASSGDPALRRERERARWAMREGT